MRAIEAVELSGVAISLSGFSRPRQQRRIHWRGFWWLPALWCL